MIGTSSREILFFVVVSFYGGGGHHVSCMQVIKGQTSLRTR